MQVTRDPAAFKFLAGYKAAKQIDSLAFGDFALFHLTNKGEVRLRKFFCALINPKLKFIVGPLQFLCLPFLFGKVTGYLGVS